ncbi:MAG: AraC family transcriptional regulator [Cytophagales bacterium]|nr:AraC family transcriptional regulator [Cytophagales bacterium]
MTYTIFDENFNEIMSGECFHQTNPNFEYLPNEESVSRPFGHFNFKQTIYKDICISNWKYDVQSNTKLHGRVSDDILCISHIHKGESRFSCGVVNTLISNNNSLNLYYLSGKNHWVSEIMKGNGHEKTDILISKKYTLQLIDKYPDIFESIRKKIHRQQSFALFEHGTFANSEFLQILDQLNNAYILGNASSLYIDAKIMEFYALLLGRHDKYGDDNLPSKLKEKILAAKLIIEENYNNPPSILELAQHLGVSSTTMKKYFKKMFNYTVFEYLFEYRMKQAGRLLDFNSDLNITEIAERIGYEHSCHFCTAFKRKFGITPSDYRRKVQKRP